jgi:hypothetical protein
MQKKVGAIKQKSTDPTKWNASKLQIMVFWFKRPRDSKLLQRKEQLLQCYLLTCNCSEQERNYLKKEKTQQLMMQLLLQEATLRC